MLEKHQEEALQKAFELLRGHFDGCLVVVATEDATLPEEIDRVLWSGGYAIALGMTCLAQSAIEECGRPEKEF